MATIADPDVTNRVSKVNDYKKGLRVSPVSRGAVYSIAGVTGTMAAALGANSTVFAVRLDPSAGGTSYRALIQRVILQYTTIIAYTTPLTAGRRLAIFRGTSSAAASGGTAIAAAVKRDSAVDGASQFDAAEGGDMRIATTTALTVSGYTYETEPIAMMNLLGSGTAGAYKERIFAWDSLAGGPLALGPGQVMAVRNPQAMDAAGTWELGVEMEWAEGDGI